MDDETSLDEIESLSPQPSHFTTTTGASSKQEGTELSENVVEETSLIAPPTESSHGETIEEDSCPYQSVLSQAYNFGRAKPPKDEVDEALYLRLVKEVKVMPIKRILNSIKGSAINLQYYGLDCAQIKPLSETLMDNTSVKELNLKNNTLNLDAMYHLGLMLRRNVCLTTLNLSQCKITTEGIEMLGIGLEICPMLSLLDLSYNEFGDKGIEVLAGKLCYNTSITNLILSHNNLTHQTGIYLAETMEENYSLQHLDLSWNQIAEEQGLKKFLYSAVEHNESILSLDLSWNTLSGEKISNILKTFIGSHKAIKHLNLSHNRFETVAELTKIAKGINTAQNLKVLDLSFNGVTADTAFALLSNISAKAKINTLRLDNVWVKPEFEKLRKELKSQAGINVIIEGVTGGFGAKAPDMQTLLLKRAHHLGYLPKKAKNKKDFGWFLLRLQTTGSLGPVKKAKFEKLVVEDNIKFDEGMVDELAKKFKDDSKKVDLNLMLEQYMLLYPNTNLPVKKEKKKKKASGEKKTSEKKDPEKNVEILEDQVHEVTETVVETRQNNQEVIENADADMPDPQYNEKSTKSSHSMIKEPATDGTDDQSKELELKLEEQFVTLESTEIKSTTITIERVKTKSTVNKPELLGINLEDKVEKVADEYRTEVIEEKSTKDEVTEENTQNEKKSKDSETNLVKWKVKRIS